MDAPRKRGLDAGDDTDPKLSSQKVSDAKLTSFIDWCNERQFNISAKVRVGREGSCAQYGMIATEDISTGEVLFSVPRPSLLSPETSSIAHVLQQAQQDIAADSSTDDSSAGQGSWVPLLLALLYEYNHPQSPWRPYLDLVPDFSELDLPMFWSSEEREDLLKGTGVDKAVTRDLLMMEKDFNNRALPFMKEHPDIFSPACQSFPLYKQMVAFVMAYSFTEPPGKKAAGADGKGAGDGDEDDSDAEEEEEGRSPPPMMVPVADILNHVAKNNAALTFDVDALRMVSTRAIRKGEEVFNTYGELANMHLLHMYGFAECYPNNHYDTVEIPVNTVTAAAESEGGDGELLATKLLFLREQDLHQAGESYVLGVEGVLTDDELYAVLKVLVMSSAEFKEHADQEGWSDDDSDEGANGTSPLFFANIPKLPASQKRILCRSAEACLSQIAGDEHKDSVAMETGGNQLSSRARYGLYVRHGQRQLLHRLEEACR